MKSTKFHCYGSLTDRKINDKEYEHVLIFGKNLK